MSFQPIENYGVIGNMRSIALVGMNGSIDFLCYPDFDSPTVFAALLDEKQGGRFQIEPQLTDVRIRQLYLPDTNILITRFLAEEGVAELTDFMPIESEEGQPNEIVRMVRVIRGSVAFAMHCQPRFKYATSTHRTELGERCAAFFPSDEISQTMSLYATVALEQNDNDVFSRFTLESGETASFVLGGPHLQGQPPEMQVIGLRFHQTVRFWKTWMAKSKYKGRWREMVHRSALLLKLLISREHGSLIAAPTFSLPEEIGGVRNWDYRFTWLRDATFTLYALIRLGFVDEAEAFIDWLKGRLSDDAERGPLQVMYGIDGRQKLDEVTLGHFCGYENSRPVRIGNAAYQQLQLDIYGEMMDSIYLANKYGDPISHAGWQDVQRMLEWLGKNWQRPDEGIWEVRGRPREFLHSRVMCWVAFDRALRLAQKRSLSGPLDMWQRTRDEIRKDVFTNFCDEALQAFVQVKSTKKLDASALLMPMMRFISPVDPMWVSTMRALERTLIEDVLVRRYDPERPHLYALPVVNGHFTPSPFCHL